MKHIAAVVLLCLSVIPISYSLGHDSKSFTLAEIEMRTGVKRPTLYLYLNRRKNGEL